MKQKKWMKFTAAGVAILLLTKENGIVVQVAGSEEKKVITFYGFSDWVDTEPYKSGYIQAKKQFEAENPDYTIQMSSDPWSDWTVKSETMFASGSAADVFILGNDMLPVCADSGCLLNLENYIDQAYFDQFFENVREMYKWDGDYMAIPFTTDCRILWYNRDIFEEAGLDPQNPPKTWEELLEDAKIITEKTGKPGFGLDLGLKEFPAQSLLCASDFSLLSIENGMIRSNVKKPQFRKYLELLHEMKDTYEPDYANLNHHDVASLFAEGNIGMIIGNTLIETDIYDKDFGMQAKVPVMEKGSPEGSFGGGFGIAVNSETREPQKAVEFAKILCDEKYSHIASDIPASYEGAANCIFAKDEKYSIILDQIQYARQVQPKTLYYTDIEKAVYNTVARVVIGDMDIDAEIDALDQKIYEIIGE